MSNYNTIDLMQLIQFKDWQNIFPTQWQRINNRKVNEACSEVETIYQQQFDVKHMFDKNGQSLFFKDIDYLGDQEIIYKGTHRLPLQETADGYTLNNQPFSQLHEFIETFYEQTGNVPEWKDNVWQSLENLKNIIEDSAVSQSYKSI